MHKTIFVFGNPLEKKDSAVFLILPVLKITFPEIIFKHTDPTEDWTNIDEDVLILDTVINIKKVTLFKDASVFSENRRNTVHDYDLSFDLKLLKKLKKINKIFIIGIPPKGNSRRMIQEVGEIINSISP